jgi:hypothetical protein
MKKIIVKLLEKYFPARICSYDAAAWMENPRIWNPADLSGTNPCREMSREHGSCLCGKFVAGQFIPELTEAEVAELVSKYQEEGDY